MDKIEIRIEDLKLEAGRLSLDFADTADWHASEHPTENLNRYADLVAWARKVGLLTEPEAQQLLREAKHRADEATAVLEQAIGLREAIYRIFSATASGRLPAATDLATLNLALSQALRRLYVAQTNGDITWAWDGDPDALDQMLWPVARSAADLLTSGELNRVKECEDDRGCGYLFFDTSRNHSRRWCDMRGCGNRAKVRRFRKRKRAV